MGEFRLETERLVLREWREEDAGPFAAMSADQAVMQHLNGTVDAAASRAVIDRMRNCQLRHGYTFWAMEALENGDFLGFCGLRRGGHAETPVPDELEIGWRLRKASWGQGLAREAAQACIDWAWENTADARISAWTVPANMASWGLMLRLGMAHRPELDFDHPAFDAGHPLRRHLVYTIDRPA